MQDAFPAPEAGPAPTIRMSLTHVQTGIPVEEHRAATGRARNALALGLLAVLVIARNGPLLEPGRMMLDADLVQDHGPTLRLMREAFEERALPFWNPHAFSGSPYFSVIDKPLLYPPVWALLPFLHPNTLLHVQIALHGLIGAWGMFFLVSGLARSRLAGLACAGVFAVHLTLWRLGHGLPYWGFAEAWLPWAALAARRGVRSRRPGAWGVLLGSLLAVQVHAGGVFVATYTAMLIAAIGLFEPRGERAEGSRARCLSRLGATAAAVALGLTAARVLPLLEWIPLTNRGEALDVETARGEVWRPWSTGAGDVHPGSLLFALGAALVALRWRWREAAAWIAASVLAFVLATGLLHELFFSVVPGYDRTRHVARGLALYVPSVIAFAGVGLGHWIGIARARLGAHDLLWPVAAAVVVFGLGAEHGLWPGQGEKTELRLVPIQKAEERVATIEDHGERSPGFRVYTTARWDLAWIYGRGLEGTSGRLGSVRYAEYEAATRDVKRKVLTKTLRVLGVHTAVLRTDRETPGLVRRSVLPTNAFDGELGESAGRRWVFSVERPLPRASRPAQVVGLVADRDAGLEREVLGSPDYDPAASMVVLVGAETETPFDLRVVDGDVARIPWAPVEDVEPRELVARQRANGLEVELDGEEGWLRLAETFALYPGWTAEIDGVETPLFRADGIVTALHTPSGSRRLELRYVPPGWYAGLWLTTVTVAALVVWIVLRKRGGAGSGKLVASRWLP